MNALSEHVSIITVDNIVVRERLRPLRDDAVRDLMESMREIGLINPITIWRPNGRVVPELVSGAHRLEAARRLGWIVITCCTAPGDDADRAALIEIDENLKRVDLSPAERANHTGKRQEIYERLHPQTKHGGAPGAGRGKGKVAYKVAESATLQTPSFVAQTAKSTGHAARTVRQDATRSKHIPMLAYAVGTSLDKGEELDALAKLPPAKQKELITKARAGEKVSARNEAKKTRRDEREKELAEATQMASEELGTKLYNVIYADPPWRFEPYSRDTGMDRAADNHYQTMTTDEICALEIPSGEDCALFLWATAPMLREALRVMEEWGFDYRSHWIWLKDRPGTGYWGRNKHELLLIGVRGKVPAPAPGEQPESVIAAAVAKHSEKPALFAEMIEEMFPNASLLEMFARSPRVGWDVWGNQAA